MRRRSASALSTAAVRLVSSRVTWAACTASALGPSSARASRQLGARATPIVTHGATNTSPTTPTIAASQRARPPT